MFLTEMIDLNLIFQSIKPHIVLLQSDFTLLLKFFKIEDIGCRILVAGTALLSFLYQSSRTLISMPWFFNSSLSMSNSEFKTYVGIGRYPYFCPRNTLRLFENQWKFYHEIRKLYASQIYIKCLRKSFLYLIFKLCLYPIDIFYRML